MPRVGARRLPEVKKLLVDIEQDVRDFLTAKTTAKSACSSARRTSRLGDQTLAIRGVPAYSRRNQTLTLGPIIAIR